MPAHAPSITAGGRASSPHPDPVSPASSAARGTIDRSTTAAIVPGLADDAVGDRDRDRDHTRATASSSPVENGIGRLRITPGVSLRMVLATRVSAGCG